MEHSHVVNQKEQYPGTLTSWQLDDQRVLFHCDNQVILALEVLSDRIVRFRYATEGFFYPDFSYAIDPNFQIEPTKIRVIDREHSVSVKTAKLEIRLQKEGLLTTIRDRMGKLLLKDDKGFHWERNEDWGTDLVFMSKQAHQEESYFGLGDKSCQLNVRGERLENWVTDCFGYGSQTDPLYRAIPFYYGLREGRAYGIFFDNSFRTFFDFAKERSNASSFWAHGGEMNYYFIYGPELMDVAEQYTDLTGRPELPPQWAMGFHQCKWSYYPESRVREIASEFRERKIPCDAVYLDIDYMDGYRCFTWHPDRFPQPEKLIEDLKRDGFHTVVIIDPGIKIDHEYDIFQQGLEGSHYLRRPDGQYAQGKVWPGWCYFPDYTRPATREWWSGLFRDLMLKQKIAGVWNDMNEPALFDVDSKTMPDDVRHDYDGHSSSHRKAHNVYGMQMARATQQGVKHYAYPNRPFMITRATFSGGQRYSSVWTGDNNANWEHLQLANTQCQRLSVSGFSHCGTDIGGFNDQPDGELFVRWLQTGIFHPLCRVHSIGFHDVGDAAVDEEAVAEHEASAETRDQEPWSFGEPYTEISRKTIELRYQLMPYLYTAFWQYVQKGTPVLKPLSFVDQHDPETHHRMEEFVVGDHLLIAPISEQGAKGRYLYLPKGLWYDFRDDRPILGEQEIWTDASLEEIPMYIQAGAVFPMAPVMQYTGEFVVETLDLHVYFTQGEQSTQLYEDAGEGYDYQEGQARIHQFDLLGEVTSLRLTHRVEGKFPQAYRKFRLTFHGMPFGIQSTVVDGERVSVDKREKLPSVVVSADFLELHLL